MQKIGIDISSIFNGAATIQIITLTNGRLTGMAIRVHYSPSDDPT